MYTYICDISISTSVYIQYYIYEIYDINLVCRDISRYTLLSCVAWSSTSGHIFRILADPGVRRLKVEPRKRPESWRAAEDDMASSSSWKRPCHAE